MSNPIILSDDEEDQKSPLPSLSKKPRTLPPPIFVLDDDPTPQKQRPTSSFAATSSFVPDTPIPDLSLLKCTMHSSNPEIRVSDYDQKRSVSFVPDSPMSDLAIVKCTARSSNPVIGVSESDQKLSGNSRFICLESEDDESESGSVMKTWKNNEAICRDDDDDDEEDKMEWRSRIFGCMDTLGDDDRTLMSEENASMPVFLQENSSQVGNDPDKENFGMEKICNIIEEESTKDNVEKKVAANNVMGKKRLTKEERAHLMEEKKRKKELQKAALKAEAAELKKLDKEKQMWEKGKFALKSIVAEIDTSVVEQRSIGGHLLNRFSEKGITYRIKSNPIEKSIIWTMTVPENISELSPEGTEIRYVLLVYEAEEFCNLVINQSLLDHVSRVRRCYSNYTVCYVTNRLMAYINKREKEQYKNPGNDNGWRRPPVEEALAKLTTHFLRVHYRNCIDEAEIAEHIVGLTCSLASCQFRNKLTRLSVNANGSLIPKDSTDKNLIKKSPWLKALVAIPKVQPRFAVAIWKKYPTMKSLLRVYMDPSLPVHEKEFLLEDLSAEGIVGGERRVGRICSKRVYRVLMAQSGSIKTDEVEDGADFFRHLSS
ncbi:crossover junction endonuclease EME1B-like isoform X2 [Euphorbia lathyris]|uniref:crossover junction endonuclease EME1B-like isoform X2 n=1 Tax=Euphorbia lathyris TaxID=212925 RepID=UPI003313E997